MSAAPPPNQTKRIDAEIQMRRLDEDTIVFDRPFYRGNIIPIGGRSTAVRLSTGVFVLASTPCTDATASAVRELGDVRYIVGPDAVHWLYLHEWKKQFEGAKVIGVRAHEKLGVTKTGVEFDYVFGAKSDDQRSNPLDEVKSELRCEYFHGFGNKDVAFLHEKSGSLIQADLLFNLPSTEQYDHTKHSPHFYGLAKYLSPLSSVHRFILGNLVVDTKSFAESAQTVDGWPIKRIIPCHGNVIEGEQASRTAWRTLYQKYLPTPTSKI